MVFTSTIAESDLNVVVEKQGDPTQGGYVRVVSSVSL